MVLEELGRLEAPLVLDSRHGGGFVERQRRIALAERLSDWHLLTYWRQIGFINEVGVTRIPFGPELTEWYQRDIAQLAKIATSPNLEEDNILDPLLGSDGWQTLMTIVKESRRKFSFHLTRGSSLNIRHSATTI